MANLLTILSGNMIDNGILITVTVKAQVIFLSHKANDGV